MFKRRATNEKASEMREHPEEIRYALMGCLLHVGGELKKRAITYDKAIAEPILVRRIRVRTLCNSCKHLSGSCVRC